MPLSIPMGGLGLTLISCCLTAGVVGNAYYQKKQFYPSVVYITKSNPSMAAIYLMAFTLVILIGKGLKKIFFGTLRAAESEHLIERFFYAVTETCLAFTVFRDDFSPKFVALFTVLLFLKAFHWLADYRVDFMERSPLITRIFHLRVASLLVLLSTIDILLVRHAYHSTMSVGASVQLVFGFEYAILVTVAYNIGVKYICHAVDLQSENPWENKAMYLLYTELFVGFLKVLLYLAFLSIMVKIHTFPLFIIRPMYLTMKSFKKALQDILQSRRAIHNMNTQYPNATEQDLSQSDNVCIICRDEMLLNSGVKKLPCNHLFHAICLRSWFQRQQTCPTCRLDVLRPPPAARNNEANNAPNNAAPAPNIENNQQQQPPRRANPPLADFFQQLIDQAQQRNNANNNQQPNNNNAPTARANAAPVTIPPFHFVPPQVLQQMRQQTQNGSTAVTTPSTTTTTTTSQTFTMPAFPPMMPLPPLPPLPRNYSALTQKELEEMEGREREHIVKRLEALHNINTLVNAAFVQLTQYNNLVMNLDINAPLPPRPSATDSQGASSSNSSKPAESDGSSSSNSSSDVKASTSNSESTSSLDSPTTSKPKNEEASEAGTPSTDKGDTLDGKSPQSSEETSTAEEVRRRRLEHFVDSNH